MGEPVSPSPDPLRHLRIGSAVVVVLLTIWIGAVPTVSQEKIVHLQTGKPVMLDGKIGLGEWDDSAEVRMSDGAGLYLKCGGEFVYVAVQFPTSRSGVTDFYIASEDGGIQRARIRWMLDMSLESGGEYTVVRFPASVGDSNPQNSWRVEIEP